MKSSLKSKIIILITIGILFALSPIITNNHSFTPGSSDNIGLDNENLILSKISGKISINGNSGWASAKTNEICTGNGTQSEPYVIEDLEIDSGGVGSGIRIYNSDVHFKIENCSLYNMGVGWGDSGIHLYNVDKRQLINNSVYNSQSKAILLEYSNNNSVSRNRLYNITEDGLGVWYGDNNSISENILTNIGWAISLHDADLNNIIKNEVNNNTQLGIELYDSNNNNISENEVNDNGGGIILEGCNYTTISGNNASNNGDSGIGLRGNNNIISGNTFNNNTVYGINLQALSHDNLIFNNTFMNNLNNNAEDEGNNNNWSSSTLGNYWGDYSGKDADDDGIGDTPYSVPGNAGSQDNFPIWWDAPVISINLPSPNDYFAINPPNFDISIEEGVVNLTWYTLDGGITNKTFTGLTGTIDQTLWNSISDGSVTLRFYANDSSGHIGFEDVTIWKDLDAPRITINSPVPYQLWGVDAPTFSLTIDEPNIQTKLYSINGRPNITFTTQTQFSQSEWNTAGNGTVSITFYVIDKVGNTNSSGVIIRKDAYIPDITINTPEQDGIFGNTPPEFNISIIEEDLESMWYTIEGDLTEYPFTGVTGTISQEAWDHAIEGDVTITFYVQDRAGNIGIESVVVTKSIPSTPSTDGILGYNLIVLLGVLSVVAIVISTKLKKFNK